MLRFYWRIVFRPYLWLIVAIAAATFVISLAEVASIGLIVPVAGIMIEPEQSAVNPVLVTLQRLAELAGLSPRPESIVMAGLLVVAVLVVLKNVLVLSKTYWVASLSGRVSNVFRARVFDAYLRSRFGKIMHRGRGAIYEDIVRAGSGIQAAITVGAQLLASATYVLTTLGLLIYLSWWATLIIGGLVFLGLRAMRVGLEHRSKWVGHQTHTLTQQRSALLVDAIDGARVVKAHTLEADTVARMDSLQGRMLPLTLRLGILREVPAIFFEVTGIMLVVLLVGLVFNFPQLGLTLPTLMALVVGLRRLMPAASGVNTSLVNLSTLLRQIEVADEVLHTLPREQSGSCAVSPNGVKTLQLEHVSFHYPGHTDARVLTDVHVTLRHGQVTALVGHTGTGKTTIADLLVRLYDPTFGRILVDGVDLRELELATWRRGTGYVGQDTFLFNATMRDNVVLWDTSICLEEVERAARVAQLHEFVLTLSDGYDTVVGDRGLKLSGGQRQRVAIARAILHEPDVLVFDEATSALDNVTEKAVHAAIGRLRSDAIVVLIAHRLSTVQDADQIIVLRDGRVVEQGQHEELLKARGEFWALYQGHEQELEFVSG